MTKLKLYQDKKRNLTNNFKKNLFYFKIKFKFYFIYFFRTIDDKNISTIKTAITTRVIKSNLVS